MTILRAGFAAALIVLLAGCASSVRTKISTFHDSSVAVGAGTIRVEPLNDSLKGSLEFGYYKERLEEKLKQAGYSVQTGNTQYVARLDYNVSRREAEQSPSSQIVVATGVGFHRRYSRTGLYFSDNFEKRFEFERLLVLVIADAGKLAAAKANPDAVDETINVLEITARSVGNCESLPIVYEEMLEAIFKDLKRPNGSMQTVKVKGDSRC
ncbi:hypothetical protein KO528_03570 [Saccharophagus degradans]|uniref:Lipoprotein n=1 Tax=Saccharophagus degradans TaxID=86304 RepID=A0AAW7X8K0_9GAMM|nr:hypothetical protein [Saccharophagus degradans]MBU2984416.1 hypothetical protein [Saccharophagus degradans]MDO6422818.1 hypothetical protein [Saccharophagus degradans]MDO6609239.1 hypothetical protein [Saccharophagus degradans]